MVLGQRKNIGASTFLREKPPGLRHSAKKHSAALCLGTHAYAEWLLLWMLIAIMLTYRLSQGA